MAKTCIAVLAASQIFKTQDVSISVAKFAEKLAEVHQQIQKKQQTLHTL